MKKDRVLYLLAFVLGLAARLVVLGRLPLDDAEASLALQALALSRGQAAGGVQAGYLLSTGGIFALIGGSSFAARLIPALAGSLLVLSARFFQRSLGRRAALILAFGLAFDPGLLALSRQANGVMLAAGFGALALAAIQRGRQVWAGTLAGLALLGGPQAWPGIIALAISLTAVRGRPSGSGDGGGRPEGAVVYQAGLGQGFWTAFGITVVAAGTAFLSIPGGLSALFDSLPAYLQSWSGADPVIAFPARIWLLMLPIYAPIPLVFGLWGAARGFLHAGETRSAAKIDRFLGILFLAALVLGFLNPGREPASWVWVLIPLWALAARVTARVLRFERQDSFPVLAQACLTAVMLLFAWMTLVMFATDLNAGIDLNQTTGRQVLAASLALILITALMMAWGWSRRAAGRGLLIGMTSVLALYTLSAASLAGGMRQPQTAELWRPAGITDQLSLAVQTAAEISLLSTGDAASASVHVAGIESPALQWALNHFTSARFTNRLPVDVMPDLVFTPISEQQPVLAAAYRGQDFNLTQRFDWESFRSLDWLNWLIFRQAPGQPQPAILWARDDLFPDSAPPQAGGGVQ